MDKVKNGFHSVRVEDEEHDGMRGTLKIDCPTSTTTTSYLSTVQVEDGANQLDMLQRFRKIAFQRIQPERGTMGLAGKSCLCRIDVMNTK